MGNTCLRDCPLQGRGGSDQNTQLLCMHVVRTAGTAPIHTTTQPRQFPLPSKPTLKQPPHNPQRQIPPRLRHPLRLRLLAQLRQIRAHSSVDIHIPDRDQHAPFPRPHLPEEVQREDQGRREVGLKEGVWVRRAADGVEGRVEGGNEAEDGEGEAAPGAPDAESGLV